MPTFQSPGSAASRVLRDILMQQQAARLNQVLDGISIDSKMRDRARAEQLARQQDADRMASIAGPGSDLTPEQATTLRGGGYQIDERQTLPSTSTVAPFGLPAPPTQEEKMQFARDEIERNKIRLGYKPSEQYQRRQETYTEQLARQQREAAQAERDEQRQFRDSQAVAQRQFQGEQNEANRQARAEQSAADRELKTLIASMSQSQSAETRALGNELKRLQVQAAQDKLDAAHAEREQATKAKAQARADVRELAQSLINDPALDRITGNVGALTPDVLPGAIDVRKRLEQLISKLSLEGRSQLKGQGAVSDFEAKLLGAAASAIDPRAGGEMTRKHLKAIVNVMSDGEPNGGSDGRVRRYNPATGKLE